MKGEVNSCRSEIYIQVYMIFSMQLWCLFTARLPLCLHMRRFTFFTSRHL